MNSYYVICIDDYGYFKGVTNERWSPIIHSSDYIDDAMKFNTYFVAHDKSNIVEKYSKRKAWVMQVTNLI